MNRRAVAWGTLVPVLFGFAVVGWVWWRDGFALEPAGSPGLLRIYVGLIPAFPAVGGLAIAALVWLEARFLLPRIPLGRAGRYCKCGYDLTGNVSGTCPECGTQIERRVSHCGHRSGTLSGRWLILSGAVIALYGALVIPWIRAMRDRQTGITGTTFVVVGIALVIVGIGLKRGWWR